VLAAVRDLTPKLVLFLEKRHGKSGVLDTVLTGVAGDQYVLVEKGTGWNPNLHQRRDAYRAGVVCTRLVLLRSQDEKVAAEILLAVTDTPELARLRAKEIAASCNKIGDTPDVSYVVGDVSYSNPSCKIFSKANVIVFVTARSQQLSALNISKKIAANIR
jgi:hypothetical protein